MIISAALPSVLMVLANYIAGISWAPPYLKHAKDIGLTVIDVIAPAFIFAIGLTYGLSFRKRLIRDGLSRTAGHFLKRNFSIIGIGCILSAGETLLGQNKSGFDWGVLQAIGTAGLITLPFLLMPDFAVWICGIIILIGYQFFLDSFFLSVVLRSPHGGLFGSIGWSSMMVFASALGRFFHRDEKSKYKIKYLMLSFLILAAGIFLSYFSPVSKNRVSSSYILVSLGISALVFYGFYLLELVFKIKENILSSWGKNPLLLYVLHLILLGFMVFPDNSFWYSNAPWWIVAIQIVLLLGVLSGIAVILEKKEITLSL